MDEQTPQADATTFAELERFRSAVGNATTAMMMIDRDRMITYINGGTRTLLARHENTLRDVYPGFSVEKLVGASIDDFHANPTVQAQLLSGSRNLPHEADIQVGGLGSMMQFFKMHEATTAASAPAPSAASAGGDGGREGEWWEEF